MIAETVTADIERLRTAFAAGPTSLAAMSGGVDSAVAAALAVRAGARAVGVTMRLFTPGEGDIADKARQCCGPTAFEDARAVAASLGIAHHVVNFEDAFHRAVVDYFCDEYLAGRTPNPCVACNNLVKFGALLDFARAVGATTMITGHYARISRDAEGVHLRRAADRAKDQSYMLAGLRADQLASVIAPLGDRTKDETRAIARELAIGIADKPDSMDLCFVDGDYRRFILQRHPDGAIAGPVVTIDGREVGAHDGLLGYTVGQRKGIASSGLGDGPWYVVRTDRAANSVVIGRREDLARDAIECSRTNVLRAEMLEREGSAGELLAVCRYRSAPIRAFASRDGDALRVRLREPARIVSPGQLLVLYDAGGDEVVASGVIEP